MQVPNSNNNPIYLPMLTAEMNAQKSFEAVFNATCVRYGCTPVILPTIVPSQRFTCALSGENLLPPGPQFVDPTGTSWSLRSDMTLFLTQMISRYHRDMLFPLHLCYSGKTVSFSGDAQHKNQLGTIEDPCWEQMEFGVEKIGDPSTQANLESVELALRLAQAFGFTNHRIVFGDSRIFGQLLQAVAKHPTQLRTHLTQDLKESFENRDHWLLGRLLAEDSQLAYEFKDMQKQAFLNLQSTILNRLFKDQSPGTGKVSSEESGLQVLKLEWLFDPLMTRPKGFYTGFVFDIYSDSPHKKTHYIGGGGRYDALYSRFGIDKPAIGFMLKDPIQMLESKSSERIRIALPKGRLTGLALKLYAELGIEPEVAPSQTRKLIIASKCSEYEFLVVKNADVGAYFDQGTVSLGIVGSDTLDESKCTAFRPAAFNQGSCKICLAGRPDQKERLQTLRRPKIATKYIESSRLLLQKSGLVSPSFEVVPLQGSVELASVINLADAIVDLVETGNTLKENDLVIFEDLGSTRIHLALTPTFYYKHASLWQNWITKWKELGELMEHSPESVPLFNQDN